MRDTKLLHPKVQEKVSELIEKCHDEGITILITDTLRTKDEQDKLYAKGRTDAGVIVTKAQYPDSYHCWGLAFDFVPIVDKKPDWNNIGLFNKVGEIGKSIGLEWGGDWKFKDRPHFQMTFGLSINDLKQGRKP